MLQFKRSGSLVGWTGQGPPPVPSKPELIKNLNTKKRQDELEQRHQELLARQRQLQVTSHWGFLSSEQLVAKKVLSVHLLPLNLMATSLFF